MLYLGSQHNWNRISPLNTPNIHVEHRYLVNVLVLVVGIDLGILPAIPRSYLVVEVGEEKNGGNAT
jgi:hypothetical protein